VVFDSPTTLCYIACPLTAEQAFSHSEGLIMKIFLVRLALPFFCYLIYSDIVHGQNEQTSGDVQFEFIPSGLHFSPLKANHQEARVGVFKYFGKSNLKVDVGNSIDLLGLSCASMNMRFTAGIDFMAYAYTTGAQGLRLQVDAIDGLFGGNLSFSRQYEASRLQGRLRILHLSAHFVDGHYSISQQQWIDNREPIPFTRDFGELTVAHEVFSEKYSLRYYGGSSYATLVRPAELKRLAFLAGLELATNGLFGNVWDQPTYVFLANHFNLSGLSQYAGNNNVQVGVKFGRWRGKGIMLYLAYYTGNNFFNEYYYERVSFVGGGFTVDFP
jgi:hypothetical protein